MAKTLQDSTSTEAPGSAALGKGARITGDQRDALADQLAKRYSAGESIRSIADDTGRSYGFVHGVLKEAGAELRGRGGATRGPSRTATPTRSRRGTPAAPTVEPGVGAAAEQAGADGVTEKKSRKKPSAKAAARTDLKAKAEKVVKAVKGDSKKPAKKSAKKGSKKG